MIDVPTCEEQLFTQNGQRLYSQARLRDWSGAVGVDLVVEAMLKLYGLESPEQVRDALRDNNLTATLSHVNARGVLRSTDAGPKVFIGLSEESPLMRWSLRRPSGTCLGFAKWPAMSFLLRQRVECIISQVLPWQPVRTTTSTRIASSCW